MRHFVDTNIAVYAAVGGPNAPRALEILSRATISVQVLNEFVNVCLRKLKYNSATIEQLVAELRAQVESIEPVTESVHDLARRITFRYKLSFYDSVLLASALLAECEVFYSEDLQDGLVVEGSLTIRNPFA